MILIKISKISSELEKMLTGGVVVYCCFKLHEFIKYLHHHSFHMIHVYIPKYRVVNVYECGTTVLT